MERKDWEEWRRGNCWKGKSRRNEEERTAAGKGKLEGMDRRKIMEREDWEKWKRRKKLEKEDWKTGITNGNEGIGNRHERKL